MFPILLVTLVFAALLWSLTLWAVAESVRTWASGRKDPVQGLIGSSIVNGLVAAQLLWERDYIATDPALLICMSACVRHVKRV